MLCCHCFPLVCSLLSRVPALYLILHCFHKISVYLSSFSSLNSLASKSLASRNSLLAFISLLLSYVLWSRSITNPRGRCRKCCLIRIYASMPALYIPSFLYSYITISHCNNQVFYHLSIVRTVLLILSQFSWLINT